MNKELRDKIRNQLKTSCGNSRIMLPKGFLFSEKGDTLTITFQSRHGFGWDEKPCNMQEDSGAFEGWAAALYVHYLKGRGQICLDIFPEDVPPREEALYTKFPHYSRFLYRVLRFSQQYDWFHISSPLEELVKHFQEYLSHNTFTNNLPQGEAGVKESLESVIESQFAKEDAALLKGMLKSTGVGEIYRQLPVGLFKNAVCEENRVFTGQKSAIDLWTTDGDTLTIIELKAGGNKMVGAVTELFFYANYAYDLFVDQGNTFQKNPGHGERGYDMLSDSLQGVRGCLLLNEGSCHPLVDDRVLKVLNGNCHSHLTYDLFVYDLETVLVKENMMGQSLEALEAFEGHREQIFAALQLICLCSFAARKRGLLALEIVTELWDEDSLKEDEGELALAVSMARGNLPLKGLLLSIMQRIIDEPDWNKVEEEILAQAAEKGYSGYEQYMVRIYLSAAKGIQEGMNLERFFQMCRAMVPEQWREDYDGYCLGWTWRLWESYKVYSL